MSIVLMYGAGVPVVKLGRMAGQFAKPRSEDTETINGVTLPSYRGDNINSSEFTEEARRPDPSRLLRAYDQSCSTLNLLRAFSNGGYASMQRVSKWNLDFMEDTERGKEYRELASQVDAAINFMAACGIDEETTPAMNSTEFYTAHEALHLGYEEKLTRLDSTTEEFYGCSAHFLWCGERTRQPEGAHMEYFRGISNPIGIKISDKSDGPSVVSLVKTLNPENVPGRITLISRMGAEKLREHLPRLITAVEEAGLNVLWVTDPMHGNTIKTDNGFKTRPFERVRDEIMAFFEVHEQMGTHPGGVHLEMTGQDVTECTGGTAEVTIGDLSSGTSPTATRASTPPRRSSSRSSCPPSWQACARAEPWAALADRGVWGFGEREGATTRRPSRNQNREEKRKPRLIPSRREREGERVFGRRAARSTAAKDARWLTGCFLHECTCAC